MLEKFFGIQDGLFRMEGQALVAVAFLSFVFIFLLNQLTGFEYCCLFSDDESLEIPVHCIGFPVVNVVFLHVLFQMSLKLFF